MGWTLETNVNDGYPHNANTRYGNPGLVTPYPDGMWTIQSGVNDGYPHSTNTRYGNPGLVAPYPDGMWMIQSGVNDGYPHRSSFSQPKTGLCLIYLGTKQPLKLYNGAEPVLAAYFGSVEVFRTGTSYYFGN